MPSTGMPVRRNGGGFNVQLPNTVPAGVVTRAWLDVNVRDPRYGAQGNVQEGLATISSGSLDHVTVAGYTFVTADLGKSILIANSTASGFPTVGTIASVSAGQAVLAAPIGNASGVAGVRCAWGTDDDNSFQAAQAAAGSLSAIVVPHGTYFVRTAITANLLGAGSNSVKLIRLPDRTINGTYYPTGNWHPVLCNPQAFSPTSRPLSTPDSSYEAAGVTVDLFVDPSNPQAWNGLQGSGVELYSLLRATLRDIRVQNTPFSGIEIASNRAGSEHGDGVGNAGSGTNDETPPSGAYLKEPAPCEHVSGEGRLEVNNFGWQWANFYGNTNTYHVWQTVTAPSNTLQIYDSTSGTTVSGNQAFPTATLTVASTSGFLSAGKLMVPGVTGVVSYTGKTGTTFTGCTGGTGTATDAGNVWSAADLSHFFPGLRIGCGGRGVLLNETPQNNGYEVLTIKALDSTTGTLTLDSPTTLAHGVGVLCGPVPYWGDPGFGTVIRQPCKHIYLDLVAADYGGWGGLSIGQAQSYDYDALAVKHVHVNHVAITRCGAGGAPGMKIGFMDDVSVGGGFIGDNGGELVQSAGGGTKALVLKTSQARRFFAGEGIRVGNPILSVIETATVSLVQPFHIDTGASVANGSATVTVTANQWRVGEKIEGTGIVPFRTDTATVTNTSATVTDASITTADRGRPVSGTGIPQGSYVGNVNAGVSFQLSSSSISQVNVTAIADGTAVTIQLPNATVISGGLQGGGTTSTPGDLITGTTLTMSMNATTPFTGPLQGGDTLFLAGTLANSHLTGEQVFFDPATAPGIAIQEVGTASGMGVKISNLEIVHHYDGVAITQKDAPPPPMEVIRHSLSGVHARFSLRYGFNEQDCQNIMHTGIVAEANGDTGIIQSNTNGSLANTVFVASQAYGNKNADWSLVSTKYQTRGCLGIADDA